MAYKSNDKSRQPRKSSRDDSDNDDDAVLFGPIPKRQTQAEFLSKISRIKWDLSKLPSFNKIFYRKNEELEKIPEETIAQFFKENQVTVDRPNLPRPCLTFKHANFPSYIQLALEQKGFERPSPIQSVCWPIILSGLDTIGLAQTGSGKTLAFSLPAVWHINDQDTLKPGDGPIVLILAPTRELVQQIQTEFNAFGESSNICSAAVYGGALAKHQLKELKAGVEIVIATPGRLIDFVTSQNLSLARVTYLVMDEADRMLDMGFQPQIEAILSQIRPDRQTLMFSATWPESVQELAHKYLRNPVRVTIGSTDIAAAHTITQTFEFCNDQQKLKKLFVYLDRIGVNTPRDDEDDDAPHTSVLVFTETRREADELGRSFKERNIPHCVIHGDKSQEERERALSQFKTGRVGVLIATDVASRGLDVKGISHVVNYSFPNAIQDYVHRIGRTGRAGATGHAHSFFTPNNAKLAPELLTILKDAGQEIPSELIVFTNIARSMGMGGKRGMDDEEARHGEKVSKPL